jgi:shikimate kinase
MILKLKRTPGIYLVGFMASGKSTIGRLLAERIGWYFADVDQEIEAAQQMPIWRIFESLGESEFRRIEHAAMRERVKSVECGRPTVIALGGGAFVRPENFALLENNGVTIWLDCPFDVIQRRVGETSHRPLARDPEKFAQLYDQRREAYARADYQIAIADDDPSLTLEALLALPLFE